MDGPLGILDSGIKFQILDHFGSEVVKGKY